MGNKTSLLAQMERIEGWLSRGTGSLSREDFRKFEAECRDLRARLVVIVSLARLERELASLAKREE